MLANVLAIIGLVGFILWVLIGHFIWDNEIINLILLIALIICCVQFYRKGFNLLKSYINQNRNI